MIGRPYVSELEKINSEYRMFSAIRKDAYGENSEFLFSAEDSLSSMEFETCCGSEILRGYTPPFDAAPIAKLKEAGGMLIGKTNVDEFAYGSFQTESSFGVPRNPFGKDRICGNSGGSACAAALLEGHVSIGMGICAPASYCGVFGLMPTYGRVSRQGAINCCTSIDQIGILSSDANDLEKYLGLISGKDLADPTSYTQPELKIEGAKIKRIAIPKEYKDGIGKDADAAFLSALDKLKSMGTEIEFVDIPELKYAVAAGSVISAAEASSDITRYCGMRYGKQKGDLSMKFDDYFTEFRTKYIGDDAKRNIFLGTYVRMSDFRDRYYVKALNIRMLVIDAYKRILKDYDAVLTPTVPTAAPKTEDAKKYGPVDIYKNQIYTLPANLSGMPHLSIPCGYDENGMPFGMQFVTDHWNEDMLISVAKDWQNSFEIRKPEVSL